MMDPIFSLLLIVVGLLVIGGAFIGDWFINYLLNVIYNSWKPPLRSKEK